MVPSLPSLSSFCTLSIYRGQRGIGDKCGTCLWVRTGMEMPASHLLATGLEQVTCLLPTQFMPPKNGGSVINHAGVGSSEG